VATHTWASMGTSQEFVYLGGRKLVFTPGAYWGVIEGSDRLGSAVAHLPYGEELSGTTQSRTKFATYWRDESGFDYADQRYYTPGGGRFLSADPIRAMATALQSPVTWNLFLYVAGDPVNQNDPTGLCPPGMVEANSDQRSSILSTAASYAGVDYSKGAHYRVKDGLLTGIDCSGLVSQALAGIVHSEVSFTQAQFTFTTGQTSQFFSESESFRLGDIIWFKGHVGIVSGLDEEGNVTSFIGSQTSTGVATVDLTDPGKTHWQKRMSSAKAYRPCVPAPQAASGAVAEGSGSMAAGGGSGTWTISLMWAFLGAGQPSLRVPNMSLRFIGADSAAEAMVDER